MKTNDVVIEATDPLLTSQSVVAPRTATPAICRTTQQLYHGQEQQQQQQQQQQCRSMNSNAPGRADTAAVSFGSGSTLRGNSGDGEPCAVVFAQQPDSSFLGLVAKFLLQLWAFARRGFRWLGRHVAGYSLGVVLILCVTVIWVASSEWIQHIFGSLEFDKPYFLTYFNTTGFCLWNAGYWLSPAWSRVPRDERVEEQPIFMEDPSLAVESAATRRARAEAVAEAQRLRLEARRGQFPVQRLQDFYDAQEEELLEEGRGGDGADASEEQSDVGSNDGSDEDSAGGTRVRVERVRLYSVRKIWRCAAYFCPLWFFANYLFNVSLSMTSVASNTILSSTSSMWTLALSYLILRQPVGPHRWLGVALCVSGTVLVGVADRHHASGDEQSESLWGDLFALVSAFFYASYTTVLKLMLPEDERFAMGMVFGAVGVINFLFLWPGLIALDVWGIEKLQMPSWSQFWPLLLNSLIGTNLSDVLWARSVVLTSPVVATLGLSLTTPLSMVVDLLFKGQAFTGLYVAGAVMTMCGFLLANVELKVCACVRQFLRR